MTQKDKELLLKDLSARLPYGVIVRVFKNTGKLCSVEFDSDGRINATLDKDIDYSMWSIDDVKPYLRPISSMTEDERHKYFDTFAMIDGNRFSSPCSETYDYLNSIHIDYRGLIEKGLALEAPEHMYA